MRKFAIIILVSFLTYLFGGVSFAETEAQNAPDMYDEEGTIVTNVSLEEDFLPGVVIVTMKKNAGQINQERSLAEFASVSIEEIEDLSRIENDAALDWINQQDYHQVLRLTLREKTKDAVVDAVSALQKDERVLQAMPDYLYGIADESAIVTQSFCEEEISTQVVNSRSSNTSLYPYSTVSLNSAWEITTGSATVKVAVMDTGIDQTHPDLSGNICSSLGTNVTPDETSPWTDLWGHGTKVAGIIAADGGNTIGTSGVCWNVSLVSIKVFYGVLNDENNKLEAKTSTTLIYRGLQYAINNRIPVLNYSGSSGLNNNYSAGFSNYPGLFVFAAGNSAINIDADNAPGHLAQYDFENLLVVAASTSADVLRSSSSYGAVSVDLAAPGEEINTTVPGGLYDDAGGTSIAAPFVAGTAALIKSIRPDLTSREIKDIILSSVDVIPALEGKVATGGRLNVYAALLMAQDYAKRGELLAGDFDGDGTDEVAAFFQEKENGVESRITLRVWESTDTRYDSLSGVLRHSSTTYGMSDIEGRIVAGDFSGDGRCDIAMLHDAGLQSDGTYKTRLKVLKSNSSGTLTLLTMSTMTDFNATKMTNRVAAGDFNGDGYDDIAAVYDYGPQPDTGHYLMKGWVWEGNSKYSYTASVKFQSDWFNCNNLTGRVTAGDYNGDGYDDVAAFYDYGVQPDTGHPLMKLWTWNGAASGNYAEGVRCQSDWFDASQMTDRVVSGDFNDDGYDDIVGFFSYGNQTSNLFYFRGVANGSTMPHGVGYTGSDIHAVNMTNAVVAGDFDGDGDEEIYTLYTDASGAVLWEFYVGTNPTFVRVEKWRQY